jgi:hypothetical protein
MCGLKFCGVALALGGGGGGGTQNGSGVLVNNPPRSKKG